MNRLGILLITIYLGFGHPLSAQGNGLSLEGGGNLLLSFPAGTGSSDVFGGAGFMGQVNYEFDQWGLGIRGFGHVSPSTSFDLSSDGIVLQGRLARREYGVGPLLRYFFLDAAQQKRWYLEFGAAAIQTDFIRADSVYILPQSTDYTRIFIQGSAFSIGAGYRPKNGPWFYQFQYRLQRYETLLIVGNVNYLHPVIAQGQLNSIYFISDFEITIGLDVFGR